MTVFRTFWVRLVAAIAAQRSPRRAGIDALVPSMVLLGPLWGMPLFALQLIIIRLATQAHPLVRQPFLTLGIDSTCLGFIIAAELVGRWQVAIDVELAIYSNLDPSAQLRRRAGPLSLGAAVAALLVLLLWLLIRR